MNLDLSSVRVGIVLALLTLLYGFGLGGAFGAFEDNIKGSLQASAMGSTHDAKEFLSWLAIPSAGLCILSLIAVLVLFARHYLLGRQVTE